MKMFRVMCVSAAAVASGLEASPEPALLVDPSKLLSGKGLTTRLGSGVVKAASSLDPEFTNTLGEKFHVDEPGTFNLIGMPKDTGADLVVNATIEDVGRKDCDDLLIRSVSVFGSKLGSVSSLEFGIASEDFNVTDALWLKIDGVNKTLTEFLAAMPTCTFIRPRTVALPHANSFRHRTSMYTAICDIGDIPNKITVTWSSVFRRAFGAVYYQNDLEVYISGVGSDPAGLLGPDDHSYTSWVHSPCAER
jgi:hypothetical protein